MTFSKELWVPVALVVALPLFFIAVNGTAFWQKRGTVAVRKPGDRLLGPPQPAGDEARKHLEFAWLSQAAYERIPDKSKIHSDECLDPDVALESLEWKMWPGFPDPVLAKRFGDVNLRVEVWENPGKELVVVAFGGTVATSWKDWRSNLRWFLPIRNDEYTATVKEFAPAFRDAYIARKGSSIFLQSARLISTGHSLGGGLAQQFAYALPVTNEVPRVTQVYAFDPSPVTGYYSVDKNTRHANEIGMKIERIYERGEALASLRSVTNLILPPTATDPEIAQVRYSLFSRADPIASHSIPTLACELYKVSGAGRSSP